MERIIIDIWTNGSLTPEEAFLQASQLIIDLFDLINKSKLTYELPKSQNQILQSPMNIHTNMAIEELQLSVRAYNCLKRAQINTVADLLEYSPQELQELKNFGRKSADEVFMTLKNKLGITLK